MLTLDKNGDMIDAPIYDSTYPCVGEYVGMVLTVMLRKANNLNYAVESVNGIYREIEYFTLTNQQRNELTVLVGKTDYLEKYNQFQKDVEDRAERYYKKQIAKAQ